jgi:putative SOS response-associated peptidase YedK
VCGRFVQDDELNSLLEQFALTGHRFPDYQPRFNLAPTQTVGIILENINQEGSRQRLLGPARWSLVPPWEKTLPLTYSTFNARSEKVGSTRTFSHVLVHQRAVIPTGGYYEWVTSGTVKTPHFIHSVLDAPLAFAGLYSWWSGDDTSAPICTVTILTADAPQQLSWVHPRTPVFVSAHWWDRWLDHGVTGTQGLVDELVADQSEVTNALEAYPVGPVRGEGPKLIEPLSV